MTQEETRLTVGEVAHRFGITIRTLHHYDDLGLLVPSDRSAAGYRLYTESDLRRLAQIVVYRRLELSLDEIAELLTDGEPRDHLLRQRERVTARLGELQGLIEAIDTALEKEMNDRPMTDADMRELFGEDFDDYQAEAQAKFGESQLWLESQRRTSTYTKAQWIELKAEGELVEKALADAFRSGKPADSEEAMDAAEMHRLQVNKWFYDCSPQMHPGLGDLYVSDPRYVENYDGSFGLPGLAAYIRDAFYANARRG